MWQVQSTFCFVCFSVIIQTLIGDILTEVEQANQVKRFGKSSLQEGKISRNKEEKTRQELEAFSSRWNGLGEEVLKTANR